MNIRIGQGYDIHCFKEERPMVLGGVSFDTPYGLDGHSDADVLTHAICDALLGAAGLPDIGHYFPNTDPKYKNIDSQELLKEVVQAIRNEGYDIGNIDASLIAEKPKIGPRIDEMKAVLAQSAGIETNQIGIKATTNEGLGSLGRGEGAAAHATALLAKIQQ
ncbi:MAG: 2-C-methyl-D-erythritol 2,4-cyclodiphosphate synthase [Opitutales bacterium]|jgi:2-C-methyl-D-erythritol 2,4-cyclodiphosphate synthase|nr:2-C-methyl-D-erythritol 2,4-cyclodiphosphate synthase [Opitutales bacterium]MDG2255519.1 2-C-methyl-D-erythritol 2,4-cyclodiphosphate synthase [Opitutaceae bacterium]MBT5169349.1 2-C-methyl-D-erythritol 2,4-cyclodiphosphate synthase [Opitutales bacterium]MBT5812928.1 2-C-methyl-D-erythritol 2,4-cyclodiphosphate synthase [Opitutales bacterium]MBT6380873.1 2-C-methyl-D-erythritol 2,4-cyclodiphosphate synthase [Opitutales bacterium]